MGGISQGLQEGKDRHSLMTDICSEIYMEGSIGTKHKKHTTNGTAVANPHGDGPQHLFKSYGTWHGICGSTVMA